MVKDLRGFDGGFATISLVAEVDGQGPVGHVMVSHAWLDADNRLIDVAVLSPLGVHPDAQRRGIGKALIKVAIEAVGATGVPLLFLEGDHRYYGPRGFEKAMDLGFRRPSLRIPENAFQVVRLAGYSEDMTGTFVYHDVHWRHGVGLYR
jgi:putative acetyltransferase